MKLLETGIKSPKRWGKSLKFAIICMVLFINLAFVEAYQIKYYSPKINQTDCQQTINSIPQEYFKGLKQISIFQKDYNSFYGEYYPQLIYLTKGCDKQVLIHELAHHLQFVRGDTWNQLITHTNHFYQYQEEIINATSS